MLQTEKKKRKYLIERCLDIYDLKQIKQCHRKKRMKKQFK